MQPQNTTEIIGVDVEGVVQQATKSQDLPDFHAMFSAIMANQETFLLNQQTIIANQQLMAKEIFDLRKGVQEIYSKVMKYESIPRPSSAQSAKSDSSLLSTFRKISDESTLNNFEKEIEDVKFRSDLIDCFVASIGIHRDTSHRNIALHLNAKIFDERFWSTTAWTGGRVALAEGKTKFKFSSHITFISFFNEVIKVICGSPMSDVDFIEFVKSRTRNSWYTCTTSRQTSARKRQRRLMDIDNDNVEADGKEEHSVSEKNAAIENAKDGNAEDENATEKNE